MAMSAEHTFANFEGDALHAPLVDCVTSLLQDEDAQATAVAKLANLIDRAEGAAAEAVCSRETWKKPTP